MQDLPLVSIVIPTHRHYKRECVKDLLESHEFRIETMFNAGGLWACLSNLCYCLITYIIEKIFRYPLPYTPSFMLHKENNEYNVTRHNGYTIFVKATKRSAG